MTHVGIVTRAIGVLLCGVSIAAAQGAPVVRDCETWEANARNLMLPASDNVRNFASGAITVIGLDTEEPACCSFHVMVLAPYPDEPFRQCILVSASERMGFGGVDIAGIRSSYDATTGLTLAIPYAEFDGQVFQDRTLTVLVNQATGAMTAK